MHVGLDLLFLVPGETGGRETYSRELLSALRAVRPDLQITTFLNRETAESGPDWWSEQADRTIVITRAWARRPVAWGLGESVGLVRAATSSHVNVLHSPANLGPAAGPFVRVLTLHDLMFRRHPELVSPLVRLGTEALLVPAARRAHSLITATTVSRDEIVAELGIPAGRIEIIPHGLTPSPAVARDPAATRSRLGAEFRPLVLAVGTHVPHKNHAALLAALVRFPAGQRPMIVVAGHDTDGPDLTCRARELGVQEDVRLLGAVSIEELENLYAAANVYVTATRHEGFGLPAIEAMSRGVPLAASDIPVLRAVASDAATWFDPDDPGMIAAAVGTVLAGGPEIERQRALGRTLAARYTWTATAEATAAVYDRARSKTTKTRLV